MLLALTKMQEINGKHKDECTELPWCHTVYTECQVHL